MHPYLGQLAESNLVFIDTETSSDGSLWSVQFSTAPGTAAFVSYTETKLLDFIAAQVARPDMTTVVHNAVFDLPVMAQAGIISSKAACTMVMAYLLQSEPQGLKPLTYRHAGISMQSFTDITAEATRLKALLYLAQAVEHTWPNPDPILEFPTKGKKAGSIHVRHPQNISKKIYGILRDSTLKDANPFTRWYDIKPEDGRGMVEDKLDVMHRGYLQDIDLPTAVRYGCRDADATARIYPILWAQIQSLGLEDAFWTDMEALTICIDMMQAGILVDVPYLKSLSAFFESKLNMLKREITELSGGCAINPNSPEQVSDLLFNHLKLKWIKRTTKPGQYATGDEVLAQLVSAHPVVQKLRDYKEYAKFRSTYTEKIPKWVDSNSRVHTTIKTTRTSTGRLASSDPNLQNIPVRKEDSRKIRMGFIAQPGCSLVAFDLNQIELRCFAHFSQDTELLNVYRNGGDIHTKTGCHLFNMTPETLPDYPERRSAKTTNFSVVYEVTAHGLYEQLVKDGVDSWTVQDCQGFIDDWSELYPGVIEWRKQTHAHARRYGYVRDLSGRIRHIPGVRCKDHYLVAEALRQANNMPSQGTAAYILKKAMGQLPVIYMYYRSQGYIINPLLQVHDELIFEIQDEIIPLTTPIIKGIMENAVHLSVPTPVNVEVGQRWGELEKWEA